MRIWKILGLAGLAGVTATGVVVARDQRRRQVMTPEQVRDRLRERHAAATADGGAAGTGPTGRSGTAGDPLP